MGLTINRRRVMGGKRLPYDAVVEYLSSTYQKGQRIDTGLVNYGFTTIRFVEKISFPNNSRKVLIGNFYDGNTNGVISIELNGNKLRLFSRNKAGTVSDYTNTNVLPINTVIQSDILADCANGTFSFSVKYNDVIFNGNAPFSTDNPCEGTLNMCLFRDWRTASVVNNIISIYQCSIWGDGVLLRDFIPVRVGQVGYMYDKVSGQLFGNAGTGDFIVGPDKN